jgi:hypothetical protein
VWPRARNEHAAGMHMLDWVSLDGTRSRIFGGWDREVHRGMVCEAMTKLLDFIVTGAET